MNDILKVIVYGAVFAVPCVVWIVSESLFFPYITGKNFAFRILVEIGVAAWLVLMLLDAKYRPKFSWIALSGGVFLIVMFVANLFGEYPVRSFMSNFERMEGYITLVHFYFYLLLLGTMLTTKKLWSIFFAVSLSMATLVAFYGFAQVSGTAEVSQGGWRIDSRLGNPIYMAIYMIFQIGIALLLLVRTRARELQVLLVLLISLFLFLLFQTGTRGAALGLVGGVVSAAGYLALFGRARPTLRKWACGMLGVVVVSVGVFILFKDTAFVQETPVLERFTDITLEAGAVRLTVWDMALAGIADRPVLGTGQGSFNYVFNTYYRPSLYGAEEWYDRAHNVVLDWLVAGGVLGFLSYAAIYAAAFYYLAILPIRRTAPHKTDATEPIPLFERSILFGVFAAYIIHNLFVFDNIVSYIYFAVVLGFLHSAYARPLPAFDAWHIPRERVLYVIAPLVLIVFVFFGYMLHAPGIKTAYTLIEALKAETIEARFLLYTEALTYSTFADQEVVEQMQQTASALLRNPNAPASVTKRYVAVTEEAMRALIEEKPNDARPYVLLSNLYRDAGRVDEALATLKTAHTLSPQKTSILLESGNLELQRGNVVRAHEYFTRAYTLYPDDVRVRRMYAAGLILTDRVDALADVIVPPYRLPLAMSELILNAADVSKREEQVTAFFTDVYEREDSLRDGVALAVWQAHRGAYPKAQAVLDTLSREADPEGRYVPCYQALIEEERNDFSECPAPPVRQ